MFLAHDRWDFAGWFYHVGRGFTRRGGRFHFSIFTTSGTWWWRGGSLVFKTNPIIGPIRISSILVKTNHTQQNLFLLLLPKQHLEQHHFQLRTPDYSGRYYLRRTPLVAFPFSFGETVMNITALWTLAAMLRAFLRHIFNEFPNTACTRRSKRLLFILHAFSVKLCPLCNISLFLPSFPNCPERSEALESLISSISLEFNLQVSDMRDMEFSRKDIEWY